MANFYFLETLKSVLASSINHYSNHAFHAGPLHQFGLSNSSMPNILFLHIIVWKYSSNEKDKV